MVQVSPCRQDTGGWAKLQAFESQEAPPCSLEPPGAGRADAPPPGQHPQAQP